MEKGRQMELLDLPEETLEYIVSLTSPYLDLQSLMLVCKRLYRIVREVMVQETGRFHKAVVEGPLEWSSFQTEYGATITERYSHCAVLHKTSLYVFGGCTSSSTTFNDLWRFDLAKGEWVRPLTLGTYPVPKACATMVAYKDTLVLFGGWSHATPYPLHQAARFFNELNIYCITSNQWSLVYPRLEGRLDQQPRGTAGHSASIIGDKMVVFGGSHGHGKSCNEVWVLYLEEMVWRVPEISGARPRPRYGHSQVVIDDHNILIIGGCGGPNMQLSDMWLLTIRPGVWTWKEVTVENQEFCPPQLWCHAAAKVGDNVVVLSKMSRQQQLVRQQQQQQQQHSVPQHTSEKVSKVKPWMPPRQEPQGSHSFRLDPVGCPNPRLEPQGAEAGPSQRRAEVSDSSSDGEDGQPARISTAASLGRTGMPSVRPNAMRNRQKQLDTLKRYEQKLQLVRAIQQAREAPVFVKPATPTNPMHVHVLDIENCAETGNVRWRTINTNISSLPPEETIFFTLHYGRGELITFGGIHTDLNSMQGESTLRSSLSSNTVHFIRARKLLR